MVVLVVQKVVVVKVMKVVVVKKVGLCPPRLTTTL